MSRFTRHGHAVRCEGDPFATCVDETAAMMVLNALRDVEERSASGNPVGAFAAVHPRRDLLDADKMQELRDYVNAVVPMAFGPPHTHMRQGDEMCCTCGLRWAIDEIDPHLTADAS